MTELVAIRVAAHMLGVSQTTLRNWDRDKILKPIRLPSGHRRYRLEDLEKLNNEKGNINE